MRIDAAFVEVIERLDSFFRENHIRFILFGAVVPMLLVESKDEDGIGFGIRMTKDLDCVLRVDDWDEYGHIVKHLTENGFVPKPGEPPHRLFYRDFPVDLIPFGTRIIQNNILQWPNTEIRMHVPGFEHLFRHAKMERISDRVSVPVIPLPLAVYTKILAFLNRRLKRDLVDVLYMLEHYEEIQLSERRYEEGVPDSMLYEMRGAFLIGKDLRPLLPDETLAHLAPFFRTVENPYAPDLQAAFRDRRMGVDGCVGLLRAFQEGLGFRL